MKETSIFTQSDFARPDWDRYYMDLAKAAATRSNCIRRKIGAVIVRDRAIVSTGYNGTPIGVRNCFEGGCDRCASDLPSGQGYDTCICVHAEQNAIVLAARHGNALSGGAIYSTARPCFGCLKEIIQAGLAEAIFEEGERYPTVLEDAYQRLVSQSGIILRKIATNPQSTSEHPGRS